MSHDLRAHFIHPPLDHHLAWYFIQFVVSLEVSFNLLRGNPGLFLHFMLDDFLDTHLGLVGEVIPLVAVYVRVFV